MLKHKQVSGGNCQIVLLRESSPGVLDTSDKGVLVQYFNESLSSSQSKQSSALISGKRGGGKPIPGQTEFSGGLTIAPYAPLMGHFLRALCGSAQTEKINAIGLLEVAVTDEGKGYSALPINTHSFVQDSVISITGTINYNGVYRVEYGSDTNKLIIKKPYVEEICTVDAKAHRGRVAFLFGDVRDMGNGNISLPVHGSGVTLNVGEKITIFGTTNYDGEHVLVTGTNAKNLCIASVFVEETIGGIGTSCFAVPSFYKHHFILPKEQPTVALQKYIAYANNAVENPYSVFSRSKVNGLSFSFGNQGEIQLAFDFSVGDENSFAMPLADAPKDLPAVVFYDKEVSLWFGESRLGDVQTGSISLTYGIEGGICIGDMGKRTVQAEGDPVSESTLTVFLQSDEYTRMSDDAITLPFALSMSGTAGEEFFIHFPEAELSASMPTVQSKAGMTQEIKIMGFVSTSESVNEFTLINRVETY